MILLGLLIVAGLAAVVASIIYLSSGPAAQRAPSAAAGAAAGHRAAYRPSRVTGACGPL